MLDKSDVLYSFLMLQFVKHITKVCLHGIIKSTVISLRLVPRLKSVNDLRSPLCYSGILTSDVPRAVLDTRVAQRSDKKLRVRA